jgi:VWFA-related protein
LRVTCDLACDWSLDGEDQGILAADGSKKVPIALGQHLIEAITQDRLDKLKRAIEIETATQTLVSLELRPIRDTRLKAVQDPWTVVPPSSILPLNLGLLVETSWSPYSALSEEKWASGSFVNSELGEGKGQGFLMQVNSKDVELLQDFTSSSGLLEKELGDLVIHHPVDGTEAKLSDAIFLASDVLLKNRRGPKALVLLSKGMDRGSKVSLYDAIASARHSGTRVYSIMVSGEGIQEPMRTQSRTTLQRISLETGGASSRSLKSDRSAKSIRSLRSSCGASEGRFAIGP